MPKIIKNFNILSKRKRLSNIKKRDCVSLLKLRAKNLRLTQIGKSIKQVFKVFQFFFSCNELNEFLLPSPQEMSTDDTKIKHIIPKTSGQLFFEAKPDLLLCKPRLMPLKSLTLEKLEKMQQMVEAEIKLNASKPDNTN